MKNIIFILLSAFLSLTLISCAKKDDSSSSSNTTTNTDNTFTVNTTTEVLTTSGDHGLVNDDTVTLTTTGTLPAGLSVDRIYYVLTTPAPNTLTLSTTKDGTTVDITGTGSGTHTLTSVNSVNDTSATTCPAVLELPTITGCNGVDLTAVDSIYTQSSGIISTPNGFSSSTVTRIEDEQYIDLKDEGCLQLGKDGQDFALSMWLKASGPSNDQTSGDGSQIIGSKSQYNQQKPGFLLHTQSNVTTELQNAGKNADGVEGSCCGKDGRLVLRALSTPADNGWRKTVMSEPFPADTWTHVVLNYRNNANSGETPLQECSNDTCASELSIYVNLLGPTSKSPGHGTQAAIDNLYFSTEDGGKGRLRIGDEGWGQIRPFEIANFKSYSRILTESERKALFLSDAATAGFSTDNVTDAINKITKHMAGQETLSASKLNAKVLDFAKNSVLIDTNEDLIKSSLALVHAYENGGGGPLFVNDNTTTTQGGYSVIDRTGTSGDGKELHRAMLSIQQSIHDNVYNTWTAASCTSALKDQGWLTANHFPGAAAAPENPSEVHTVSINASVPAFWGQPVAFSSWPARRPTGFYLSPGSIGQVTVPQEMVNAGFSVLVGSHTVDHEVRSTDPARRLHRVTRTYSIVDTVTPIANPLGGGVYILVPHKANLGQQNIQLSGVIKQPYFSLKASDNHTDQQWKERRTAPGPWAVFESDKFMLNVPRSWIYAYDNATSLMQNWDKAMDGVSELFGYPLIRNRKVLYMQVDVYIRHGVYGIGYPQINNLYNPKNTSNGNKVQWFLLNQSPARDPLFWDTEFHELGHATLMQLFQGEGEAIVNFPHVYVMDQKFGVDFDKAFRQSRGAANYTVDDAAIHWMITENFRNGKPMDKSNTTLDEFRYQARGYAKYADIARLFGWQALKNFFYQENLDYNAGVLTCFEKPICRDGLSQTDSRILRLSKAADADLTPLIHFWGVHPDNSTALSQAVTAAGLDNSTIVRDKLVYYAGIAPDNNTEFNTHFKTVFPYSNANDCASPHYGCGWYHVWSDNFSESHGAKITNTIQSLLTQYFPGTNL